MSPATTATATFVIDAWREEQIVDDAGARIYRTHIDKTFAGDIEGTSTGWMTMAHSPSGAAAYVGFERFEAAVHGRRGSFVLHHTASGDRSGGGGSWTVLPGSGTGELAGLAGRAEITRHQDGRHTLTLDYDRRG